MFSDKEIWCSKSFPHLHYRCRNEKSSENFKKFGKIWETNVILIKFKRIDVKYWNNFEEMFLWNFEQIFKKFLEFWGNILSKFLQFSNSFFGITKLARKYFLTVAEHSSLIFVFEVRSALYNVEVISGFIQANYASLMSSCRKDEKILVGLSIV